MEKKTSIIACGLTIHNTPVEVREKLSIPEVRHHQLSKCGSRNPAKVPSQACVCAG